MAIRHNGAASRPDPRVTIVHMDLVGQRKAVTEFRQTFFVRIRAVHASIERSVLGGRLSRMALRPLNGSRDRTLSNWLVSDGGAGRLRIPFQAPWKGMIITPPDS